MRRTAALLLLVPCAVAALAPARARAAECEPGRVSFRADRATVDGDGEQAELSGNVRVCSGQHRFVGERLELKRDGDAIEVSGDGSYAACACEPPPWSVDFTRARLDDGDLVVDQPVLRVGGVPALWAPALWLRQRGRVALLAPELRWRGVEGAYSGAGVRLPPSEHAAYDVYGGGYWRGGARVGVAQRSPEASARLEWDRYRSSYLLLDGTGSLDAGAGAVASWRADALRGERARIGADGLDAAARRRDRARLQLAGGGAGVVGGVGFSGTDLRGRSISDPGEWGPSVELGADAALGDAGHAGAATTLATRSARGQPTSTVLAQRAQLELAGRPGPLGARVRIEQISAALVDGRDGADWRATAAARAALELPLSRNYGKGWLHRIVPFGDAGARAGDSGGARLALASARWDAGAGVRSVFGSWSRRSALAARLRAGAWGDADGQRPVLQARMGMDAEVLAGGVDSVWLPEQRAGALTARLRLGTASGPAIIGSLEGRTARAAADALDYEGLDGREALTGEYYDARGAALGSELRVPWTRSVATTMGAWRDLVEERWLGFAAGIAWAHQCGCLDVGARVTARRGRSGVDAGLIVTLSPE